MLGLAVCDISRARGLVAVGIYARCRKFESNLRANSMVIELTRQGVCGFILMMLEQVKDVIMSKNSCVFKVPPMMIVSSDFQFYFFVQLELPQPVDGLSVVNCNIMQASP